MMVTLSSNADDEGEGDNDDEEDSYNMQCHTCYKTIKKKIEQVIMSQDVFFIVRIATFVIFKMLQKQHKNAQIVQK